MDALLTVEEAAKRLRVGRSMAYSLVASGELQSIKIGKLRRVPLVAVERYVAGKLDGDQVPDVFGAL